MPRSFAQRLSWPVARSPATVPTASIEAYIRDGLGISDDEVARLRRELLE